MADDERDATATTQLDSYFYHLLGNSAPTVNAHLQELAKSAPRNWDFDALTEGPVAASLSNEASVPAAYAQASETAAPPSMQEGIPVLILLRDSQRVALDVVGFKQGTQIGNVLTGSAQRAAITPLLEHPNVLQIDVSRDGGGDELDVSIPATKADAVHVPPVDERGKGAIVAVIDSGFDVLHECFQDDQGRSRILALWDQTASGGMPPTSGFGQPLYGALHTRADIMRYQNTGLPAHLRRDPRGHGTHVASIAAGRAVGAFQGGMAPEADMILVISKIETPPGDPKSIGYSRAHIDALEFIDDIATREDKPVVVNISQGMNAGAHDGSSLLEAAFDNFTSSGRMPGRVLVKSAGNTADMNWHAQFQIGDGQLVDVIWDSFNAPRARDILEFWFTSSDDISFELSAPKLGGTSQPVSFAAGQTRTQGRFASGNFYSMTLDRYHRDNGDARLLISIEPGNALGVALGHWKLRATGKKVQSQGFVDGWIERPKGATISFVTHNTREGSLTIPGTANSMITVAALDRQSQGMVMPFSSHGGTRDGRHKPDVGAPGDGISAAGAGTLNGVAVKNGSSMAAPHVSGAIALLMANRKREGKAQANANQIRAVLSQSARGFNGRWNAARGWGMLDVKAFLNQF